MSDFVLVKSEYETVDVKEEFVEAEDPLLITSNSEKGYWIFM